MGYRKAEQVLPAEIITLIQDYVDGECIYIPRKENARKQWGEGTKIREELGMRNERIFKDYERGLKTYELAEKYFLSEKSIQRILTQMRNQIVEQCI